MGAREEAGKWISQAEADLRAARHNAQPFPHVACFLAQQAAEKALKGAQLALTGAVPRTHSLSELESGLASLGAVLEGIRARALRDLGRMYTEARYPDVLPDAVPADYFTPEDADEALAVSERAVTAARRIIEEA